MSAPTDPTEREIVAKAMCAYDMGDGHEWNESEEDFYTGLARAALRALAVRVVPSVEEIEAAATAMIHACRAEGLVPAKIGPAGRFYRWAGVALVAGLAVRYPQAEAGS